MSRSVVASVVVVSVFVVHAAVHATHTFCEAGFSIAAADALARGDGLAPFPGAEWVESFDRPLWVALLSLPSALGLHTEWAAKVLGIGLGVGGLGLAAASVRQLGLRGWWPWLAALGLALHPWWTLWAAAGSGEVLFAVLLMGGLLRLALELEDPRRVPLGGVLLGLAGIARWDAVLPLGFVTLAVLVLGLRRGRTRWMVWTLGMMVVPALLWLGARLAMFGTWEAPWMTLWFRMFEGRFGAANRQFVRTTGRWLFELLPVAVFPVVLGLGVSLRRRSVPPLVGLLMTGLVGQYAAIWAVGGDWVFTGRRFHLVVALAMPVAVLGVHAAWTGLGRVPLVRAAVGVALVVVTANQMWWSARFVASPETTLDSLRRRVDHIRAHARAHHIRTMSLADPDPQAWMVDTDWPVVDLSGRSGWTSSRKRRAVRDRMLSEDGPTYVHIHAGWDQNYHMTSDPRWRHVFEEIAPYPIGPDRFHVGTWVRKTALAPECETGR